MKAEQGASSSALVGASGSATPLQPRLLKSPDQGPATSSAKSTQQPTALKHAQEPAAQPGPAPRRPREHWLVYCYSCRRNFYSYVLGRGQVKYSRARAELRAAEHRIDQPDHVVKILRSSSAAGVPTLTRETSAGPWEMSALAAAEGERK